MTGTMPASSGPVLGVLGGLGPAATADFLAKLTDVTDAGVDQEHIASITYQDPTTPDRSDAILLGGESPLPKLMAGIQFLNSVGVDVIAIPCNSSHYWYQEMAAASDAPIVNIVDAVADQIHAGNPEPRKLGLLSTDSTAKAGVYNTLKDRGDTVANLTDMGEDNPAVLGIKAVKAGDLRGAHRLFDRAIDLLVQRGAEGIIFGCTEVSTVMGGTNTDADVPMWDASEALARACAEHFGKLRETPSR